MKGMIFVSNLRGEVEGLLFDIPFYSSIDGEMELLDELYENYINDSDNIERIKRFIITDYLTQLDNNELAKMFINFKSRKSIEKEEMEKQEEVMQSLNIDTSDDDDMPF